MFFPPPPFYFARIFMFQLEWLSTWVRAKKKQERDQENPKPSWA